MQRPNWSPPISLHRLVILCLVTGVLLRVVVALAVPTFHAPDEQAHVHYIHRLVVVDTIPTVSDSAAPLGYQLDQPPLYYVLLSPLYLLINAVGVSEWVVVRGLRLVSVGLWAGTLIVHFGILKRLGFGSSRPFQYGVGVVSVAMFTFLPAYIFSSAAVNNDNLVFFFGVLIIWLLLGPLTRRRAGVIGVVVGLALLTKVTAGLYALAVPLVLIARRHATDTSWPEVAVQTTIAGVASALLFVPWIGLNLLRYGSLTPTIINARDWPSLTVALAESMSYLFRSFWAVAGPTHNIHHLAFAVIGAVLGLLIVAGVARYPLQPRAQIHDHAARRVLWAFTLLIGLNLALVFWFGLLAGQAQGRYLYLFLSPISIFIGIGAAAVYPARLRWHATVVIGISLYGFLFVAYGLSAML